MKITVICLLLAASLALGGCVTRSAYYAGADQQDTAPLPKRKPPVVATGPASAWQTPREAAASTTVQQASRDIIGSEPISTQRLQPTAPQSPAAVTSAAVTGEADSGVVADEGGVITGSYEVASGDHLYAIARKFGVSAGAVIERNGLTKPYVLRVGQVLKIPGPKIHVVRRGDTVYAISRRYGVEMAELLRINKVDSAYTISLGQRLMVPVPGAAGESQTAAARPNAASGSGGSLEPSPASTGLGSGAKLAALPKPPARHGGKFLWPLQGKVLSDFGPRRGGQHNDGINILAPRGAPVQAAENGVVAYAGSDLRGFGNLLLIKHAEGWITAYAHADSILVKRGQKVRRGQTVARVGSSGNVDRPQLHFEIRKGKDAVDPASHLTWAQSTAAD
jgi:murein DD-endopeptidase MepM/ murein hydrolase activator NlpD